MFAGLDVWLLIREPVEGLARWASEGYGASSSAIRITINLPGPRRVYRGSGNLSDLHPLGCAVHNGGLMNATPASFLYVDALHCMQQRELPPGRDTPYLLVFAGQAGAQNCCDVMRVTSAQWQDTVRTGDVLRPAAWVHHHVEPDTVIAVALIEQSWRLDVDAHALDAVRDGMQRRWAHIAATTGEQSDLAFAARHAFGQQISAQLKNDALIEVHHLPLPIAHGPLPPLSFQGCDAHYQVSFSLRAV